MPLVLPPIFVAFPPHQCATLSVYKLPAYSGYHFGVAHVGSPTDINDINIVHFSILFHLILTPPASRMIPQLSTVLRNSQKPPSTKYRQ